MDEVMIRANNPHPTWVVTALVEGVRQSRYFADFETAKDFANQLPAYHTPISIYKAELVAERAYLGIFVTEKLSFGMTAQRPTSR